MTNTGIPIHVSMSTKVKQGDEHKDLHVNGDGELVEKEQSTYVTFTEQLQDIGEVKTVIKIQQDTLTIIRQGAVSMRQAYMEGKETEGSYSTPYGSFQTLAKTKRVQVEYPEDAVVNIQIAYDLELQGQNAGFYQVTIEGKET
ncbi:uncharacterized beta-barrel protein YwiB (DUF1934 family) [Geomicrobium halophilum]|uniref:Uncharacterized beta-barrel protein YwiB (DUF1934 family) n=1 Tax=Geomicrobium halophilum TaxID=549000 RepID=A0A841PZP1_9BACL|nr:DUF1934 domain-containing protein [Geomicrobium halophilum]MBB6450503.1 uncharacterized beta-barrel protein YwiB (DUF1934 family) [Geomicrobium halophilum]